MPALAKRVIYVWIVLTALLLIGNKAVFASPSITISSLPETLTVGLSFDINATVSGLVASSSYYTKIRIGSSSTTLTKGQTQNSLNSSPDDWLSDSDSWTKFPQIISDADGGWNGTLTGRPADTAVIGQNNLSIRLRKVGGSTNYDSESKAVKIIAVPDKPIVLPLTLGYSLPASVAANESFFLPVTIANASPSTKYFLKGVSETSISTFNNSWLAWNGSWTDMPSLATDQLGSASGKLQLRYNSTATVSAQANFIVRIRKEGTEDNVDSSPSAILINPAPLSAPVLPLTIGFSLPATATADVPWTLTININNASPSGKYFLKTIGGISTASADLQSVSTYNGNSWLAWNGGWNSMPTINTDTSGSGSATIQTRFNSGSTTPGPNYFFVRLRPIWNEENLDSSSSVLTINMPQTNSGTTDSSAAVNFDFSLPSSASVGGQFEINAKLSNLFANTHYYLKVRIGPDSSHLTSGQTYNSEWLSDNASWAKFPEFTTDSNGKWEGKIATRLSDDETSGSYKVGLRIRKVGDDNNFDSDSKEMTFTSKSVVTIPVASVSGAIVSTVLPDVLGIATGSGSETISAILGSTSSAKFNGKIQEKGDFDVEGNGLFSWGMTILGASLSSVLFRKHQFGV